MNPAQATKLLESIAPEELVPYRDYFHTIAPRDPTDILRRALFAFASVHTGWRANVDMYALLWDLGWLESREDLRDRIVESRAGLTEGRTRSIWEFSRLYQADPGWYLKGADELWAQYRDRVQARTLGLGHAKASFFVELVYPNDAEVVCCDTHMLQNFGLKGDSAPGQKMYNYVESHWVGECKRLGLAPTAARWHAWDRKQGHADSRYWSYCLEGGRPSAVCPRQLELFTYKETA